MLSYRTFSSRTLQRDFFRKSSLFETRRPKSHCHSAMWTFPCQHDPSMSLSLNHTNCKYLSTSNSPPKVKLSKRLKRYGVTFLVVDCCTWAISFATFFVLFSAGVQMETLLWYAEQICDVAFWAELFHVDMAALSGDTAALSLSLIACTVTFPIRMYIDLAVLFVLRKMGVICPLE